MGDLESPPLPLRHGSVKAVMPKEPKYRLSQKDAARWRSLLLRHCLELPATPGGVVKRDPRYLPLTPKEITEFERLTRKRSRKICAHPKVKESLRRQQLLSRKLARLVKKLERCGAMLK